MYTIPPAQTVFQAYAGYCLAQKLEPQLKIPPEGGGAKNAPRPIAVSSANLLVSRATNHHSPAAISQENKIKRIPDYTRGYLSLFYVSIHSIL